MRLWKKISENPSFSHRQSVNDIACDLLTSKPRNMLRYEIETFGQKIVIPCVYRAIAHLVGSFALNMKLPIFWLFDARKILLVLVCYDNIRRILIQTVNYLNFFNTQKVFDQFGTYFLIRVHEKLMKRKKM